MSTIETSITDSYGDTLEINSANRLDGSELLYLSVDNSNGFEFTEDQARELRDVLNVYLDEEPDEEPESDTANEAKLATAVQWSLKAKFAYQGELDRKPVERRLVPDSLTDTHVAGESFDAGGQSEGYRQFRLDRISGEVVVR